MKYISFLIIVFFLGLSSTSVAGTDYRKDKDSHKTAKAMVSKIYKDGKSMPGSSDMVMKELFGQCSKALHKGCYFWEKSGKYYWVELNSKGEKERKIYDLDTFIKKVFK